MVIKKGFYSVLPYIKRHWFLYLLAVPGILYVAVFCYAPIYGLVIMFKKYKYSLGILRSPWVGLENFKTILSDNYFYKVLWNTVLINLINMTLGFAFIIFLALMLNEIRIRWVRSAIQTAVFLPHFISWVVFAALMSIILSPEDGVINAIIRLLGGQPIYFLASNTWFRWILVGSNIIKNAGYSTIIYLAALSGVNPELYECAIMDGAHRGHLIRYITIPRIKPTIVVLFILGLISIFNSNFEQVYNLYSTVVYDTGDVLSTYIYRSGILNGEFEQATALGFIFSLVGLVGIVVSNKFVKKMDVTGVF